AGDAVVQDAGRNQAQNELHAVGVHRVSGVVSALIPRDEGKARRQQIDDLAFPFIAPLRPEDCEIHRSVAAGCWLLVCWLLVARCWLERTKILRSSDEKTSNPMILLDGSSLTLEQLLAIADAGEPVALAPAARERVVAARLVVDRRARGSEPAYGINTGFGSFAEVKIAPEAL